MRSILAGLLLLPLYFTAAAVAVEVEPIHKRDEPIVIAHNDGETVNAIFVSDGEWQFLPETHFVRMASQTIMVAPPGEYLITTGDSSITKVIEEGRPEPKPTPGPQPPGPEPPGPEPQPQPSPDKVMAKWVIFLHEASDADHQKALNALQSEKFQSAIADKGIQFREFDDDDTKAAEFVREAKGVLPAFFLLEQQDNDKSTKEAYLVFPAPETADEAIELIEEHVAR